MSTRAQIASDRARKVIEGIQLTPHGVCLSQQDAAKLIKALQEAGWLRDEKESTNGDAR
jgi:hypothetical protein